MGDAGRGGGRDGWGHVGGCGGGCGGGWGGGTPVGDQRAPPSREEANKDHMKRWRTVAKQVKKSAM